MAIKKSELYRSIWESCDSLRGGMDASQYKDYILVLLFVKYVSDKYQGNSDSLIVVPEGGSFADMIKLKAKSNIGDEMNKIIAKLAQENGLKGVIDVTDFNDNTKLGNGKDMVDRLSDLIEIFENPELDFGKNKAEGDDLLGDAYEYLMKNFATESGKSKGQFYTPAEVSKVIAKVIGIKNSKSQDQTIYDPTCGSGSLLLKAADESETGVTIYGQEMDQATAALAKMNMILHNNPTAEIWQDNTLSSPCKSWVEKDGSLKRFDYLVANPPFSNKKWRNGFNPEQDIYGRFDGYGMPPAKNGDYAFLLHFIKSMKSTGKGAIVLPHGVLFRGNSEAEIRTNIIKRGYIKGIIGLPTNLFYGTGIPACILVLDKENAESRKGIFIIDASKGFIKDGNKNRLRAQDIQKIVDAFTKELEIKKYSRFVSNVEIKENDYNLNIPRYINSQVEEDLQNIDAHLNGGIPNEDIKNLDKYWEVYPSLENQLFTKGNREGFSEIKVDHDEIKNTIYSNEEFVYFTKKIDELFDVWVSKHKENLLKINTSTKPKELIFELSESLLEDFSKVALVDKYDVYQHIMDYWQETMQDDVYFITSQGWVADIILGKKDEWSCDLLPKDLIINKYFKTEKEAIDKLELEREEVTRQLEEMREEHGGDEGALSEVISEKGTISKGDLLVRLKEIKDDDEFKEELKILKEYEEIMLVESRLKKEIKEKEIDLDRNLLNKYKSLSEVEIKDIVVNDKWISSLKTKLNTELERISQRLTHRIVELAERYENTLPEIESQVSELSKNVNEHLIKMGYKW